MDWLNYHHLLYFWQVAHEGSISRASAKLHLTPQTISVQLKSLEEALGIKLFARRGRNLVLTSAGHEVLKYADQIFSLGRELLDNLGRHETGPSMRLNIGVADVLSKNIVYHMLRPVLGLQQAARMVIYEDKTERLLSEIAVQSFDVVLTDAPMPEQYKIRAYNHLLGESAISLMGAPDLAEKYSEKFPGGLEGAPFLLPTIDTVLRRTMDHWFDKHKIRPFIVSEFADNALLRVFGEHGHGIFAIPSAIEEHTKKRHHVERIGVLENVRMQFFAITLERTIKHPAVAAITERAREELFANT